MFRVRKNWTPMACALMVLTAGCGYNSSLLPTSGPVQTPLSIQQHLTLPPGFSPKSLVITPGNGQVPLGGSLQFSIQLVITDGKNPKNDQTLTDPGYVMWAVADPTCGIIDDQGLFTPSTPRITQIEASVGNLQASVPVTIMPAQYHWQQVPAPTANDLFGVKIVSQQEAWAVGSGGTVLHWINGFWNNEPQWVQPDITLRGVDFSDGTGWMVGYSGSDLNPGTPVIYGYSYGGWQYVPNDGTGGLYAVASVNRNDAWAVGTSGSGDALIEHWNGSSWQHDPTVGTIPGKLNAITMVGGSEGWAVGKSGNDPLILHYDGSRWQSQSLPPFSNAFTGMDLKGVAMVDGTHGWAVGVKHDPITGWAHGLVLQYDARGGYATPIVGSFWHEEDAASSQTPNLDQVPLNGIALLGGDQGWLLGTTIKPRILFPPAAAINDIYGNLLSFDGTTYQLENDYYHTNLSNEFLGISLLPTGEGFIVGRAGYMMQRAYDWRQSPASTDSAIPTTAG